LRGIAQKELQREQTKELQREQTNVLAFVDPHREIEELPEGPGTLSGASVVLARIGIALMKFVKSYLPASRAGL
jgi:hypothetical protein